MEKKVQARSIVFDLLRIISAFGIVVLHAGSMYIDRNPVTSMNFCVANFYDSLSRFGIGMFVMISGAIFLSEQKEISIKRLWTRNIMRMLIVYGVWAFGYYVFTSLYYWKYDFWKGWNFIHHLRKHLFLRAFLVSVYDYGLICLGTHSSYLAF